jgi:hypothetical protein
MVGGKGRGVVEKCAFWKKSGCKYWDAPWERLECDGCRFDGVHPDVSLIESGKIAIAMSHKNTNRRGGERNGNI